MSFLWQNSFDLAARAKTSTHIGDCDLPVARAGRAKKIVVVKGVPEDKFSAASNWFMFPSSRTKPRHFWGFWFRLTLGPGASEAWLLAQCQPCPVCLTLVRREVGLKFRRTGGVFGFLFLLILEGSELIGFCLVLDCCFDRLSCMVDFWVVFYGLRFLRVFVRWFVGSLAQ